MAEKTELNLQLTVNAREILCERMEGSGLTNPVPGLIWAKWSNEKKYKWQVGFYEEDEIQEGWLFDVSGITFYTYQDWFFNDIKNKTLDIVNGEIVIN